MKQSQDLKKELAKRFEKFKKLSFPKDTIEELGDVFVELVNLDGYIAGLASSFLQNIDIKKWKIAIDEDINKKLLLCKPKNEEERSNLQKLIKYKEKLDELTVLLIKCLSVQDL